MLVTNRGTFDRYRHWGVGSLADRDGDTLLRVAPFLVTGILLTLTLGGRLNALSMGDEAATALGAHPGRIRLLGVAAITLLCGAATAACGPIWFLGLAVPYIARLITGPDHRWILAYAVVLRPILLLGADMLGRVLTAPSELQVGIVTAFLGAPVFIALCRRRKRGALGAARGSSYLIVMRGGEIVAQGARGGHDGRPGRARLRRRQPGDDRPADRHADGRTRGSPPASRCPHRAGPRAIGRRLIRHRR
ncbi:FecCD family ABC transporter permease [Catellatospora aurea]|uniref:FecCD family ABC transporter permease n=1 Tax=Catellatospora aurea TaxID=1337874 RepID=A0ABW2GQF4_9ACTN